jgi:hypothetical protein
VTREQVTRAAERDEPCSRTRQPFVSLTEISDNLDLDL